VPFPTNRQNISPKQTGPKFSVFVRPVAGYRVRQNDADRRQTPESAVSFRLRAATSPKVVALQFPREHAISTAVFFHFSVVGAKTGGGPAGRGACRSEQEGWPARQAGRTEQAVNCSLLLGRRCRLSRPRQPPSTTDVRSTDSRTPAHPPRTSKPPARSLRTLGVASRHRISHPYRDIAVPRWTGSGFGHTVTSQGESDAAIRQI
jgi:hypothetical protein